MIFQPNVHGLACGDVGSPYVSLLQFLGKGAPHNSALPTKEDASNV